MTSTFVNGYELFIKSLGSPNAGAQLPRGAPAAPPAGSLPMSAGGAPREVES